MKPTVEACTVAIPWYEREDFAQLWELAHDRSEMPADYDVWHQNAKAVVHEWLARGRALQIVTVRPAEFLAWLQLRGYPNTAEYRRRYVEELAAQPAQQNDNVASSESAAGGPLKGAALRT